MNSHDPQGPEEDAELYEAATSLSMDAEACDVSFAMAAQTETILQYKLPALHDAVSRDDTHAALELLRQGANVNERDGEGETPLHHAVLSPNETVVRLLLEHGADIHARGDHGGSILQSAAWLGSVETVQLLLDHGAAADPQHAQEALRNCFYDNGHDNAPLLIAAGAKMGLVEAILLGDLDLVQRCLNEGCNADDIGEEYSPLMHVFCGFHDSCWPEKESMKIETFIV